MAKSTPRKKHKRASKSRPKIARRKTAVIAIGGNAIIRQGQKGTADEQFENFRDLSKQIVKMLRRGYRVVLTHGNGPQVGNSLIRMEEASHKVPAMPLDVCVADTQGSMGYMLQQSLVNELKKAKMKKPVVSLVTQVVVDGNDEAFKNPTKPVGPFYTKEKAAEYAKRLGWKVIEDSGRGWRRVVPSPKPIEIVEKEIIKDIIGCGGLVIACGGGGIPVIKGKDGTISGVEGVIDKDAASGELAAEIKADMLIILTNVDRVCLNYNTEYQKDIYRMTVSEAEKHLKDGQFPKGSMGPKIEAAARFLEEGGKYVMITSTEKLIYALDGKIGTRIVRG